MSQLRRVRRPTVRWGPSVALFALAAGVACGWLLPVAVAYVGWGVVIVAASVVDIRQRRLPRVLIEPAIVIGFAWLMTEPEAAEPVARPRRAALPTPGASLPAIGPC